MRMETAFPSESLALIKFHGWRKWSSTWTPMAVVSLPAVGTNWNTLKLTFRGNQIAVYYNGSNVVNVVDNDVDGLPPYLSGGIGAHMYMDSPFVANFDDIIVLPLASDDSYNAVENQTLTVPAPGVLGNDMQGLVTNLTAAVVTGPTHGTLSLSTNGGFSYSPATNFLGTDSFTYQANAGQTNLGTATVVITVNSDEPRPRAPGTNQPGDERSGHACRDQHRNRCGLPYPDADLPVNLAAGRSRDRHQWHNHLDALGIAGWDQHHYNRGDRQRGAANERHEQLYSDG